MEQTDKIDEFLKVLAEATQASSFNSLTLSKPREKHGKIKSLYFRPVMIRNEVKTQMVVRFSDREDTKNFSQTEFLAFASQSTRQHFFYAHLVTSSQEGHLLISRRGFVTLKWKQLTREMIALRVHDKEKQYIIPPEEPFLQHLGISSSTGTIIKDQYKKYRQISRYIELFAPLTEGLDKTVPLEVTDMGCGKGYLTFAMHRFLKGAGFKQVHTSGIDIKSDVIRNNNIIAREVGYDGLEFLHGRIEENRDINPDILIALHACDTATDDAIFYGVERKAKVIVVAPCCHKQVRKSMARNELTSGLFRHGIIQERWASDLTDMIRANILRYLGYQVKIMEFVSIEHTPKNIMITAQYYGKINETARQEIYNWMELFGIGEQYLLNKLGLAPDN